MDISLVLGLIVLVAPYMAYALVIYLGVKGVISLASKILLLRYKMRLEAERRLKQLIKEAIEEARQG